MREERQRRYLEFVEGICCLDISPSRRRFWVVRFKLASDRTQPQVIEWFGHRYGETRHKGRIRGCPTLKTTARMSHRRRQVVLHTKVAETERGKTLEIWLDLPRSTRQSNVTHHCPADLNHKIRLLARVRASLIFKHTIRRSAPALGAPTPVVRIRAKFGANICTLTHISPVNLGLPKSMHICVLRALYISSLHVCCAHKVVEKSDVGFCGWEES